MAETTWLVLKEGFIGTFSRRRQIMDRGIFFYIGFADRALPV